MTTQSDLAADAARRAAEQAMDAMSAAQAAAESALVAATAAAQAGVGDAGLIDPFIFRVAVFVLAGFVGYFVVWSVTPALHTPLMSVTNAISSVIIVGALIAVAVEAGALVNAGAATTAKWLGFFAVILAFINIVGGFGITQRMLGMYRRRQD